MMYSRIRTVIQILLMTLISTIAHAQDQDGSLGEVATNLLVPFASLSNIMTAICIIAGVGFTLGAFIQYKAHRDNPSQVRISTPILLLALGISLLGLPFITGFGSSSQLLKQFQLSSQYSDFSNNM